MKTIYLIQSQMHLLSGTFASYIVDKKYFKCVYFIFDNRFIQNHQINFIMIEMYKRILITKFLVNESFYANDSNMILIITA